MIARPLYESRGTARFPGRSTSGGLPCRGIIMSIGNSLECAKSKKLGRDNLSREIGRAARLPGRSTSGGPPCRGPSR